MTTAENSRLETVRKLLTKAERAATPEEAEAYAEKAEQLMARYSIDAALLAATDSAGSDPLGTRAIVLEGYANAKAILLAGIAQNLSCKVMLFRMPQAGAKRAVIHGHESDLEAFDMLATSLLLQATTAATVMHQRTPWINGRTFRHNFLLGFAGRVSDRMEAARSSAVAEAATTAPGAALALRDRTQSVADEIARRYTNVRRSSVSATHRESYRAGDRAGQLANLSTGGSAVGGSSRPMLHP